MQFWPFLKLKDSVRKMLSPISISEMHTTWSRCLVRPLKTTTSRFSWSMRTVRLISVWPGPTLCLKCFRMLRYTSKSLVNSKSLTYPHFFALVNYISKLGSKQRPKKLTQMSSRTTTKIP